MGAGDPTAGTTTVPANAGGLAGDDALLADAAATAEVLKQVRRALASAVDAIYHSSVMDPALQGEAKELLAAVLESRIALTERIEAVDQACVALQTRLANVERRLDAAGHRRGESGAATGRNPEFSAEAWAEFYLVQLGIAARQWQLEHVVEELRVLQAIMSPSLCGPGTWPASDPCGMAPRAATGQPPAAAWRECAERLAALDALFHANCRCAVVLRRLGRGRATVVALEGLAESAADLHQEFQRLAELRR